MRKSHGKHPRQELNKTAALTALRYGVLYSEVRRRQRRCDRLKFLFMLLATVYTVARIFMPVLPVWPVIPLILLARDFHVTSPAISGRL